MPFMAHGVNGFKSITKETVFQYEHKVLLTI